MIFALVSTAVAQVYIGDADPLGWEDLVNFEETLHTSPVGDREDGVVGGSPVEQGAWDDAVAIVFNNSYVGCTGTLIAPDAVMTAEHCTGGITHAIVGTKNWTQDQGEMIEVKRIWNHPSRDIAVLRLKGDSSVPPRLIASDCIVDEYLKNGSDVALVGFGNTDVEGNQSSRRLREGYSYIEDKNCRNTYGCYYPGDELVQGGNDVNGCFGDSGGPLYLLTDEGDFVVGVASRVLGGNNSPCRNGTIYTRPDAMLKWMENKLGEELPRPVCNLAPEPTAEPIVTAKGTEGITVIEPNDPDEENVHFFEIVEAPAHGTATVDEEGVVTYTPDSGYRGPDTLTVSVTDDGSRYEASPAITSDLTIDVDVVGRGADGEVGGCGCSGTGSAPFGWLALGMAGLVVRRRR